MPMQRESSRALVLVVWLAAVGCGSSTPLSADGGGSGGSSGSGGVTGGPDAKGTGGTSGSVPHRAAATACPHSPFETDAGLTSCTTDSECATDAGFSAQHCVQHACTVDECLSDEDCPEGSVCGCANQFGGNGRRNNRCVVSSCRVDADCVSSLCSPATDARCSSLSGYHCRGPADTCRQDTDCPAQPAGSLGSTCQYVPEVAHWQCAMVMVCNG